MQSETKQCQNCKNDFTIESDDFAFYEKMKVPPPTFCPECRMARRLNWRNHRTLFKRSCDLCNKNIVSTFNKNLPFPVYCNSCYYSDSWDPESYAQEYDFSKPFFEQWRILWNKVPKPAIFINTNSKNVEYANVVIDSSNVYLGYSITRSENVLYSESIDNCKDMMDSYMSIEGCDTCYYSQGRSDYGCRFVSQCAGCIDCDFCFDCVNCRDCFMSWGLRNKKYMFRNKQLTKEEYEIAISKENIVSRKNVDRLKDEWKNMINTKAIHQYSRIVSCQNCTGNYMKNCKDVNYSYNIYDCENSKYCIRAFNSKDSYDVYGLGDSELINECVGCSFGASNNKYSFYCVGNTNIDYTFYCDNSDNLFACFGLRKKKNCILNKQYSKEEYIEMVEKIKKHMNDMPYLDKKGNEYKYGEYLPIDFSPYSYNETLVFDFLPKSKSEAISQGYVWHNLENKNHKVDYLYSEIPDDLKDVDDSITQKVLECKHMERETDCEHQCTQAFKITQDEMNFYKKMNLPLPDMCPNCRHYERLDIFTNPVKFYNRECDCGKGKFENTTEHNHEGGVCNNNFISFINPTDTKIVYCESCYQKEII